MMNVLIFTVQALAIQSQALDKHDTFTVVNQNMFGPDHDKSFGHYRRKERLPQHAKKLCALAKEKNIDAFVLQEQFKSFFEEVKAEFAKCGFTNWTPQIPKMPNIKIEIQIR